jgi:hypothetical protein
VPIWRAQQRIDNTNIVAHLGHFLKPLNRLIEPVNLLLADIYSTDKRLGATGIIARDSAWTGVFRERFGRSKIKLFLEGKEMNQMRMGMMM